MTRGDRLVRVEWASLVGERPRPLGRNARLPPHGARVEVPFCRLTTEDGLVGVGPARFDAGVAYEALGLPVSRMFGDGGTEDGWLSFDYPLWDLAARREGLPVYQLLARNGGAQRDLSGPLVVDCYDTSFYFEDPDARTPEPEALAERAAASYERGHRAFKVKVGRGARWMGPGPGLQRDVAVMEAIREAVGPASGLFADANDGYTLNGAKEFLARTAGLGVGWLEEPFHEDAVLLTALREWMAGEGINVLLTDGESATSQVAYQLASEGLLDIVQCDILHLGFTRWLDLGQALDVVGAASAPHHFGRYLGNYVSGHLAGAVAQLKYIEWDEATVPGLAMSGYHFSDGRLSLSDQPGFAIELDEEMFARAVKSTGFDLQVVGT
jgi:L-rhamnonate dehydratase